MRAFSLPTLLLPVALAACVNTDAAVFVEPAIDSPALAVAGGVLGVSLTGSFTLKLHLGPRATGPSTVAPGVFSIVDPTEKTTILDSVPLTTTTTLPATVAVNSDVDVAFTIDTGAKPLAAALKTQLCAAAGVVLKGTIQDSLQQGVTPVYSAVVHPTGCI